MSIVYDYLKKIHDQKEPVKATPVSPASFVERRSGRGLFWMKAVAAIAGFLVLGAALYFFLPKFSQTTVRLYRPAETRPNVRSAVPDFKFLLEGIIYNPSKPFAIIDGKMYEVGGRFGDFEVVKITPDTILLKNLKDGTSRSVRL